MSAQIIDISGKLIDEGARHDLAILCRDIEVVSQMAQSQAEHWAEIEEKITTMLGQAMLATGIKYFETETMVVTLEGDEIVIEGKSIQ